MKDTIPMQAKKGRASYLGERSIGHQDPGATSSYLIINELLQAVEQVNDPRWGHIPTRALNRRTVYAPIGTFHKGDNKMADYVAAVDQGTTSTRCMIFNHAGLPVGIHQLEHEQIYPQAGWVEHDPMEIWDRTQDVIKGAMQNAGITAKDIAAVGVTNQRETTVVWDKNTGKPYHNAIVWQDTRTDKLIKEFEGGVGQNRFRDKVGLPLATYFSGPKVRWMLDNVPGLKEAAAKGDAVFGNIDTWVIWNLTGGPKGGAHVTDVTNASRTMLMNLKTLDWSDGSDQGHGHAR